MAGGALSETGIKTFFFQIVGNGCSKPPPPSYRITTTTVNDRSCFSRCKKNINTNNNRNIAMRIWDTYNYTTYAHWRRQTRDRWWWRNIFTLCFRETIDNLDDEKSVEKKTTVAYLCGVFANIGNRIVPQRCGKTICAYIHTQVNAAAAFQV